MSVTVAPARTGEPSRPVRIDEASLREAVRQLTEREADLATIVERHGMPPLWPREPGLRSLVQIVLEQQVSLASARAAYRRLQAVVNAIEPSRIAALDEATARAAGLTRQKQRYLVALGEAILAGRLDLTSLAHESDDAVRGALTAIPGLGRWSADVYLLLALRRPDVWAAHDLALAASVQAVRRMPRRPRPEELDAMGEAWRPWRSAAARLLWHAYLSGDRPRRGSTVPTLGASPHEPRAPGRARARTRSRRAP